MYKKENTIVLKPSRLRVDLDSYETIVENKKARGFSASHTRASNLKYVVITDGESQAIIADIVKIERAPKIHPDGMNRINIIFDNVKHPKNLFNDIHKQISWNNRRNIRYIYFDLLSL